LREQINEAYIGEKNIPKCQLFHQNYSRQQKQTKSRP
jgi:hypothetical protein